MLTTLAASRYGLRVCGIAALIRQHVNSFTWWLNEGLWAEALDPNFEGPIDDPNAAISRRSRHINTWARGIH